MRKIAEDRVSSQSTSSSFNLHATIQQFSLACDAKQCFLNCYEIKARGYGIELRRDPKGDTGALP